MDFRINTDSVAGEMTFEKEDTIVNNIFLSLKVQQGSFFQKPEFGSRLHLIKKNTPKKIALAEEYCREALQWILDSGRATKIDIYTEKDPMNKNRLKILVIALQADGSKVNFETFTEVI